MDGSSPSSQDDPDPGPDFNAKPRNDGVEQSPSPQTAESTAAAAAMKKEKARVRFNSNAAATRPQPTVSVTPPGPVPRELDVPPPPRQPRPSVLRGNSSNSITTVRELHHDVGAESREAINAAAAAQERAQHVAAKVRRDSGTPESRHSMESLETATSEFDLMSDDGSSIALQTLNSRTALNPGQSDEDRHQDALNEAAYHLVQAHSRRFEGKSTNSPLSHETHTEGHGRPVSEINDGLYDGVYNVPPPRHYRGSVLSQLLKLYKPAEVPTNHQQHQQHHRNLSAASFSGSTGTPASESGTATPNRKKWYNQNRSQETLANLVEASARLANPNMPSDPKSPGKKKPPPMHKRRTSSSARANAYWQREQVRITAHIAETLSRQEYIIKLCRALMLYGAPTHRLEEYLSMTARFLEIDGQFLYLPGCMIISFDDKSLHTAEIRIVRSSQGIDLGKLKDVHLVYKEIMHEVTDVEEGTLRLDALMAAKDKFHPWFRVIVFGLTSVTAAPFSFKARLIDLPLIFLFGCLVGILQLIVAPRSDLYNNVFEVSATVIISFLSRAFGSIRGGSLFCFSALAQSGIVMLLPGYLVRKSPSFPLHAAVHVLIRHEWLMGWASSSMLCPGNPIPRYRPRLDPYSLRHHLLAPTWLWHHRRGSTLRPFRSKRHVNDDVREPYSQRMGLHLRAAFHCLYQHPLPSEMASAPRHGRRRFRRVYCQLLQ